MPDTLNLSAAKAYLLHYFKLASNSTVTSMEVTSWHNTKFVIYSDVKNFSLLPLSSILYFLFKWGFFNKRSGKEKIKTRETKH